MKLERRQRFGGEHPFVRWTRSPDRRHAGGPKSPRIGYAPPENRMKLWPEEARIAGWFPQHAESITASTFRRQREATTSTTPRPTASTGRPQPTTTRHGVS